MNCISTFGGEFDMWYGGGEDGVIGLGVWG